MAIKYGLDFAFEKLQPWENNYLNEDFDYKSVMLYGETAFSKDSVSHSVKPKKAVLVIGPVWEKPGFSDSDVRRINKLYECFGEVCPPPPKVPNFLCDFETMIEG
ncbi:astacin-like metalloprotease toxin 1 [Tachypleus tridentatus]|uniref:astacin-like metalloprotease toxin 1 n=1 Tax=Tachypleus tridentatus TaxID=6853 RepID=UPI003FD27F0D